MAELEGQRIKESGGTFPFYHLPIPLELNGEPLRCGEPLELRVMGYWLRGTLCVDSGGWFLQTADQVGIRLRSGLPARRPSHFSYDAHTMEHRASCEHRDTFAKNQ